MVFITNFKTVDDGESDERRYHGGILYTHDLFFNVVFWDVDIVEDLVNIKETAVEEPVYFREDRLSDGVFDFRAGFGSHVLGVEFAEVEMIFDEVHSVYFISDLLIDGERV